MKVLAPIFFGVIPPTSRDATSGQAATHPLPMKCRLAHEPGSRFNCCIFSME